RIDIVAFQKCRLRNSRNSKYQFWRQDNHPIALLPHQDSFAGQKGLIEVIFFRMSLCLVIATSYYLFIILSNWLKRSYKLLFILDP
ncbi:MAG: hypothetical protein ACI8V8_002036, partial [Chitinophagales bacterium]